MVLEGDESFDQGNSVRMSRLIGPVSDDLGANEGTISTTSAVMSASLALPEKNNVPIIPRSLLVLGKRPRNFDNTTTSKNIPSTHARTAEWSSITADHEQHLSKSSGQKPRAPEVQYPPGHSTYQTISHPSYDTIQARFHRENMSRHTQDDEPISRALGQRSIESVQVTSSIGRNTPDHGGAGHEADSEPSLAHKLAIEAARILAISGAVEGFRRLTSGSPVAPPIIKTQSNTSYINPEQTIDPGMTAKLNSKSPADFKPNTGHQVHGTLTSGKAKSEPGHTAEPYKIRSQSPGNLVPLQSKIPNVLMKASSQEISSRVKTFNSGVASSKSISPPSKDESQTSKPDPDLCMKSPGSTFSHENVWKWSRDHDDHYMYYTGPDGKF
jgi:hypothetical protein